MRRFSRRNKKTFQSDQTLQTKVGRIDYLLKRSSARRTLCISVDDKAKVEIAVPYYSTQKEIESFIHDKAKWIQDKLKEAHEHKSYIDSKSFTEGQEFLFLGKKITLHIVKKDIKRSSIQFDGLRWTVSLPRTIKEEDQEKHVKQKVIKWYRRQAEEILGGRIFHYSRIMGIAPKKIAVRHQKRIWGNCDYNTQTIHLNWQIILSPLRVVDYVVVHEMCHLTIPNHSKRFWARVRKFMPDFEQYKKWLKINSLDMILP